VSGKPPDRRAGSTANDATLILRVPSSLVERLKLAADRAQRRTPGPRWSVSAAARALLERALAEDEGEET
jgi:hypothetical protein